MANKKLRVVLWIIGVGCGVSILGVVVPWSWFEGWMAIWGFDVAPRPPILLVYGGRVGSAILALVGVYFLVLARDPAAHAPFLKLGIGGLMFYGLVCLVTGLTLNMRPPWYLVDTLFSWVIGLLLLIWRPRP